MNKETKIADLKNLFSETLNDLILISQHTQNMATELLRVIDNQNFSILSAEAENIGATTANILKMLKGNSSVFVNSLLSALNSLSPQKPENFFSVMYSTLLECTHNTVITEDGRSSFAQYVDHEIQTDPYEADNENNKAIKEPMASTSTDKSLKEKCGNGSQEGKQSHFDTAASLNGRKSEKYSAKSSPVKLSLRREDTSDTTHTNESWTDTLQRSENTNKSPKKSDLRCGSKNSILIDDENDEIYSVPTQKISKITATSPISSNSFVQKKSLPNTNMKITNISPKKSSKGKKSQSKFKQKNKNLLANLPSTSSCKPPDGETGESFSDHEDEKINERYLNIDSIDKVTTEDFEAIMKSPKKHDVKKSTTDELIDLSSFEEFFDSPLDIKENTSIEIMSHDYKREKLSGQHDIENKTELDVNISTDQISREGLTTGKEIDDDGENSIHSDHSDAYSVQTQALPSDEEDEFDSEKQSENNISQEISDEKFNVQENENYIEDDSSIKSETHIDDNFDSDHNIDIQIGDGDISNKIDSATTGAITNSYDGTKSGIDSDDTDINKTPISTDVQLNIDNFSLENPSSEQELLSSNMSDRSFDFYNENHKDEQNKTEKTLMNVETQNTYNGNSEDSLMDVDMIEYMKYGEEDKNTNSSESTICYYDPDTSQIKDEDDLLAELSRACGEIFEDKSAGDLGNELLELLKQHEHSFSQPVQNEDNENVEGDKTEDSKNSEDEEEADKVFELLNNDNSPLSDSIIESDIDTTLSDFSNFGNDDVLTIDSDEDNLKDGEKKRDCYVLLERLPSKLLVKHKKALDDNIDWLCNLDNINKEKKSATPKKRRKTVKPITTIDLSSLSSSSSNSSDSDDETDIDADSRNRFSSLNLDSDQIDKLDAVVADAIHNNLEKGSEKDSDSSSDSDNSSGKKKKERKPEDTSGNKAEKEPLSKEELAKKAWRNDSLLRGKLSSDSSRESDSEDKKTKKKTKHKRYEDDTEFDVSSDHILDSDSDDAVARLESKLSENKISPIKRNIPLSDTDSDTDSDVQYISPVKQDNVPDANSPSQRGRKNIRSIQSDEILALETQIAKREELERIERLKSRTRLLESLSQSSVPDVIEKSPPLILDMKEETNEVLVKVNSRISERLKDHQRIGVKFMWDSCYESIERIKEHVGSGCILAHCMGLGKTFQVLALVHTLFTHKETNTNHVLIVCPLSTVNNWKKEVRFAYKGLKNQDEFHIYTFQSTKDIKAKYEVVTKWSLRKKSILIIGYEAFETVTNDTKLDKNLTEEKKNVILEALVNPGPDLVVCDEGHLIKNKKAVRATALNKIKTKRRIVLTGTPLQNNLVEYYHMVHFVKPNLLGTLKEFRNNFVNPITNGQYEDSTAQDINLMRKRTHVLNKLLAETVQRVEDTELEIYLPKMLDYAVFIQLHQVQCDFYQLYLANTRQYILDKTASSFLKDVHMLQYIGTHPHLLNVIEASKNKKIKQHDVICEDDEIIDMGNWWKQKMPNDAAEKLEYGHKMLVLKAIIEECEEVGDKLLVFSQKIFELDLIEHFLKTFGTKKCASWRKHMDYYRLDGTVKPEQRSVICDKFNEKTSTVKLLLMSVKVGGLGLNLTAANRVVIMTVNWNPSYDTQSIFRVYRFGQTKEVYVYRLIALGSMEEKIYQRTVTKLAIAHRVIDKHQIDRHYKSMDLQELYACRPSADNERPTPNVPEDKVLAKMILKLPCIYKYHEHKALLINRHEEKLTEDEMAAAWEDFKNTNKKDVPPPQPQQPQQNYPNGPTFQQAYNLGRFPVPTPSTSWQPSQADIYTPKYIARNPRLLHNMMDKLGLSAQDVQKLLKDVNTFASSSNNAPVNLNSILLGTNTNKAKTVYTNATKKAASSVNVQSVKTKMMHRINNPSTSATTASTSSSHNQDSSHITNKANRVPVFNNSNHSHNEMNEVLKKLPKQTEVLFADSSTARNINVFSTGNKQYQQPKAKRRLPFGEEEERIKKSKTFNTTAVLLRNGVIEIRENAHDMDTRKTIRDLSTRELSVTKTTNKENEGQLNVGSAATVRSSTNITDLSKNVPRRPSIVSLSDNGILESRDLTRDQEENVNLDQNPKNTRGDVNQRIETITRNDDVIMLF